MRIVDIELNRTEQVLDSCVVCIASIYQILVSATNHNLKCKNTIQYQFFVADCITLPNDVHKLFQVFLKAECKLAQESLCNNIETIILHLHQILSIIRNFIYKKSKQTQQQKKFAQNSFKTILAWWRWWHLLLVKTHWYCRSNKQIHSNEVYIHTVANCLT